MLPTAVFTGVAAAFGLTGVVFGAYGAHGLAARGATPDQLVSWQTAVQYLLIHAVALFALSIWMKLQASTLLSITAWAWIAGVVFFSGSIFVLVLGGPRWFGPITPLGGVALIAGWAVLLLAAVRG